MFNLKLKTTKLKDMVQRSIKAASNNSILPVTELMSITVEGGLLSLLTTDKVNYLYVTMPVEAEDMHVTVKAEAFAKLVSKLTSEFVELSVDKSALVIKANGTYRIEIPMDENGVVNFSQPYDCAEENLVDSDMISMPEVRTLINVLKPSLAVTEDVPMYTQYYIGADAIATNELTIAMSELNSGGGWGETEKLLGATTIDLLSLFPDEEIQYSRYDGNVVMFNSPTCALYTMCYDASEFPVNQIYDVLDTELSYCCELNKAALLQALDRVSLFIGAYDKDQLLLTFTKEGLSISSMLSNGEELVPYVQADKFGEFACNISSTLLQSHIKASEEETITIWYGADSCINLEGETTSVIIALNE